jgi:uncharacterized membrane protein (Fun14 family)
MVRAAKAFLAGAAIAFITVYMAKTLLKVVLVIVALAFLAHVLL